MKNIGLTTIMIIVAFTTGLVWAQCGSCGACQEKSDQKCSISTSNYSDFSFTTINRDTYNLGKVIGIKPMLIFPMNTSLDNRAILVKKTRTSVSESSIVFIGVLSDTSFKSQGHVRKLKLNFPVVLDPDNKLIMQFGLSEKSPALIFLNQDGELVKTASEVNKEVLARGIIAATVSNKTVDPVCGMSVSKRTAAGTFEYQGNIYYFCSDACKKLFEKNPAEYVKK